MFGLGRKAQEAREALSRQMREAYKVRDWKDLKHIATEVISRFPQHPKLFFEAYLNLESAEIGIALERNPENPDVAMIQRANRLLRILNSGAVRGYVSTR